MRRRSAAWSSLPRSPGQTPRRLGGASLRAMRRSEGRPPARPEGAARPRSRIAVLLEDLVFLDGAVAFVETNDEREAEGQRGDTDDDRGEDQDVGQRIGIDRERWID